MPLETLENGKSFLEQRTKINESIVEVNRLTVEAASLTQETDANTQKLADPSLFEVTPSRADSGKTLSEIVKASTVKLDSITEAQADTALTVGQGVQVSESIDSEGGLFEVVSGAHVNDKDVLAAQGERQLNRVSKLPSFNLSRVDQLVPTRHLKQFSLTGTPKVVFIGDSLSTYAADSLSTSQTMAYMIEKKIKADNPDIDISFVNRAIGGQTFTTADGIPTNTNYSWYTNDTKPWLEYIEDEEPDLVFISFGMNGADSFAPSTVRSIVSKINAFSKVPDIVFINNMISTYNVNATYPNFGSISGQKSRENVAGYIRAFAKYNGYGLIDVNRVFDIARSGEDKLDQAIKEIDIDLDVSVTGAYSSSVDCTGFKFVGEIVGDAAFIDDAFTNNVVGLKIGNGVQDLVFIRKISGNFRLDFYDDNTGAYKNISTGVAVPTSNFKIIIEILNGNFIFKLSESPDQAYIASMDNILKLGGNATIRVGYQTDSFATGPFNTVSFYTAINKKYQIEATNQEIWDFIADTATTKSPYGGNGVNHPTSLGSRAVFSGLINSLNFKSEYGNVQGLWHLPDLASGVLTAEAKYCYLVGTTNPTISSIINNYGSGIQEIVIRVIVGGTVTVQRSSSIYTTSGSNVILGQNEAIHLVKIQDGQWIQIGGKV